MMKKNLIKYISIICVSLIIGLTACKDGEIGWDTDSSYTGLFRPIIFTYFSTSTNSIGVSFTGVVGAYKYVIQVSEDSLEFNNIVATQEYLADTITAYSEGSSTNANLYHKKFSNLNADTRYSVRMIAINSDSSKTTQYVYFTTTTMAENLFNTVDATAGDVTFTWTKTDSVNYILLTKSTDLKTNVASDSTITDDEKTNATKTISGLEAGVYYVAKLCFLDGTKVRVRGRKTFKTTGTVGSFVYDFANTEVADTVLKNLVAAGHTNITLNFTAGATYTMNNLSLPTGLVMLTFTSSSTSHPTVNINKISPANDMDGFLFENVDLVGASNASNFLFALSSTSGLVINNFEFQSCTVNNYYGVVRLNGGMTVSTIHFNECIIENTGGYGIINISASTVANKITTSIIFENSTLINIATQVADIRITVPLLQYSNCTLYNLTSALSQVFRFNSNTTLPTTLTIDKCIFAGTNKGTTLNSFNSNYTNIASYSFANSYKTKDLTISTSTGKGFIDINALALTSSQLFADPTTFNFTISESTGFAGYGVAGDLRWY
jgi:hypothetical protein